MSQKNETYILELFFYTKAGPKQENESFGKNVNIYLNLQ